MWLLYTLTRQDVTSQTHFTNLQMMCCSLTNKATTKGKEQISIWTRKMRQHIKHCAIHWNMDGTRERWIPEKGVPVQGMEVWHMDYRERELQVLQLFIPLHCSTIWHEVKTLSMENKKTYGLGTHTSGNIGCTGRVSIPMTYTPDQLHSISPILPTMSSDLQLMTTPYLSKHVPCEGYQASHGQEDNTSQ